MTKHRSTLLSGLGLFVLLVLPRVVEATVSEQRARLPPPAECPDPVTGVWMSHHYSPVRQCWDQFTLTVRRNPDDPRRLEGEIRNHLWAGGPEDTKPPECRGGSHYKVLMPAQGTLDGDQIGFWGTSYEVTEVLCTSNSYNLDHFSGTIDHTLHEFQTVNNDGGDAVNEPTVFRRVRCLDDARKLPSELVAPPPFYPPTSGCWGD